MNLKHPGWTGKGATGILSVVRENEACSVFHQ